jgi:hypothetical protein
MTRIGVLQRLAVTSNGSMLATLMMNAIRSSETSILKRATRRNIPEDSILPYNLLNN